MNSKANKNKRAFRDSGHTATNPRSASKAAPARTSGTNKTTAPKIIAAKAKKLAVRNPNRKIMERARDWKEQRDQTESCEPMRLQKALAASGSGSRREMERWIEAGLVTVNGRPARLGDKISPQDQVCVKGNPVKIKWPDRLPRIILYYKQEGEIVSRRDPQGRISVFDRLPQTASSRWVAVGRLDINTGGLLIITTSGELAQRFTHPRFEVEREYAVRIFGTLDTAQMQQLTGEGVMLDDGLAKLERLREEGGEGANKWYNVAIREGRNREVRRIFESQGVTVSRLVRTAFGPIALPSRLKRGQFYELNPAEVAAILRWASMKLPGRARNKRPSR